MEIRLIGLKRLDNSLHFQIHTDFGANVEKYDAEKLKIEALFASWKTAYNNLDVAFKKIIKSILTDDMAKADKRRDEILQAMKEAVKMASKHSEQTVRRAAGKVKIVFDTYGRIEKLSYPAETAAVYNIIQDFEGKYSAEIALVGLTPWVAELKTANETFGSLTGERKEETLAKPDLVMHDVRLKIDAEYKAIVKLINAAIVMEGEDNYREFVTALNLDIKKYADIMAQRKGRAAAKKEKKENKD
jgi:hypothetical protein